MRTRSKEIRGFMAGILAPPGRRKDLQIRQLFDLAVDGRTSEKIFERNKVDGSLTSSPGAESRSELSGAGRRADLYSSFGV